MRDPAKYLSTLILLLAVTLAKAQEFGGNPPSIKWNQVNTPEAKVIFPVGMDSTGRRVANIIHQMSRAIQPTIGFKQKQISIVLQNQYTVSNAYVGLAPFRSEFYLTPDQNSFEIGSLNWADQLAIHEYRHVQQYNNFNVGLSHGLKILFGEGGQALGNELAVPNWFFEGDAVYNETHVSRQGRGRIPYFFNGYRALWAAGRNYSYMKLRNGSYQDFVPDHYPLGYMLVSYGREKYGSDFWKNVTHNAAAYKSPFYPFQSSIKKYAGVDFKTFRANTFSFFKNEFSNDKPLSAVKKNQHFIADQEYPAYGNDSTLVYLKSTYQQRPRFILKTGTVERPIAVQDFVTDNYFSYSDGKIIYAAYKPDARWRYRTYNEIVVLDINTGKERRLTHKSKYFSPALSADGKTIVAVWVDPTGKSELRLLDAETGTVKQIIPNPNGFYYSYPKFYGDKIVAVVRDKKKGIGIISTEVRSGGVTYEYGFVNDPIAFLQVAGNDIYFTKTSGLRDRLYVLTGNKLKEIADAAHDAPLGYYQPAISATKIAWVAPTAFGNRLYETDRQSIQLAEVTGQGFSSLADMGIHSLEKDSASNILAKVTDDELPVTKYSKAHHLFNFHSLIPDFNDPNYSISLEGENVLNTFQSSLRFNYNRDEGYKQFGLGGIYGGLYPYLVGSVNYTLDRRGYYQGKDIYWNEMEVRAGTQVPLLFVSGKHTTNLSFGTDIIYNSTSFQSAFRSTFSDRSYTYLNSSIAVSNRIGQAKQNIYPHFGESLSLNYKYALNGTDANQFLASGALYLPGLLTNHNLVVTGAFQQKNRNSVISFSNNFPFARGYTAENLYQLQKVGVNYHFPIAYPDAGVANTIYLLRFRGNAFYDYTHANDYFTNGNPFKANFRSVGAELYFDTSWFNQLPITFGIRYSRLLDYDLFGGNGKNRIELIVPLTLF